MYTTLIRAHELAGHLDDPAWCVMDCRFDLADPEAGHRDWLEGHVPGAFHADLDARLSGPGGPGLGRHPLPDPAALADWLEGCGVDDATQVVCYDADAGAFAARLWWLLRWLGHDAVAVLDGGFAGWCAAGHPVEQAPPAARGRGRLTIRRPPDETSTRSTRPSFARSAASAAQSSTVHESRSESQSVAENRTNTGFSSGTASRTAVHTSRTTRVRASKLPP